MKKRLILLALALVCLLTLSACACKHETWNEADCVNPKTCAECSETEGAPLGHSWLAATCDTAKTCENCGETEGAPLGHSWLAATCETAKTCEVCNAVDGEALGHSWADATCAAPKTCSGCGLTEGEALEHTWAEATTEAPKTCTGCGATEGERIITDERFTTAATADIQGKWVCEIELDKETMGTLTGIENIDITMAFKVNMELCNDGTFTMDMTIADEEAFRSSMQSYLASALYAELAASGYDQDAADAAMEQVYGVTVEEYAAQAVQAMDLNEMLSSANFDGVYYVADGNFYSSTTWAINMECIPYTLDGDTLTLNGDLSKLGIDSLVFTRVTE